MYNMLMYYFVLFNVCFNVCMCSVLVFLYTKLNKFYRKSKTKKIFFPYCVLFQTMFILIQET